jgi:hypothetical protein
MSAFNLQERPMKKSTQSSRSNSSSRINAYIDELGDWRSVTLTRLRKIILSTSPNVTEGWKWDHPVWEANGLVCVAGAFKGNVKLTFSKGAYLKDPRRLFNASIEGRTWRAIDFHQGDKIDAVGLKGLIREAAALNAVTKRR